MVNILHYANRTNTHASLAILNSVLNTGIISHSEQCLELSRLDGNRYITQTYMPHYCYYYESTTK